MVAKGDLQERGGAYPKENKEEYIAGGKRVL